MTDEIFKARLGARAEWDGIVADATSSKQFIVNSHDTFSDGVFQSLAWRLFWRMRSEGKTLYKRFVNGVLKVTHSVDQLVALKEGAAEAARSWTRSHDVVFTAEGFVGQLDMAQDVSKSWAVSFTGAGDRAAVDAYAEAISALFEPERAHKGVVKTLMRSSHGLEISTLGVAGKALERGNYEPDVLAAYDHIAADLRSKDPCGKLIILDGPPGTGKTYLIRGLIEAGGAEFVFVPPNIVSSLAGPEIITCLADERASDDARPFVLVVEDADECLQQRATDNLGSISSLLNMTDGIVGAALDVRVIASTNMDLKKMAQDRALLRDGRLCRNIHVGEVSEKTAASIAERLGIGLVDADFGAKRLPGGGFLPHTIAQIYRLAHDQGKVEPKPEPPAPRKGVGFGK